MSSSHFFEGPEKKLEIILKKGVVNLLDKPKSFWEELVGLAKAQILSEIQTSSCKAYLLSESSLFVWENRLILITCGTTTLIKAAEHLISEFGTESLEEVFYERKNEYQPDQQKSSALDDMKSLRSTLGGEVKRFGRQDDHHVYIFNKNFGPSEDCPKINTVEILMYGLQGEFKNTCKKDEASQEKTLSSLRSLLPGFEIDPYFFEPEGFSFNGLLGNQYSTMHVTPQGSENYLSFEMDHVDSDQVKKVLSNLLEICKPSSFDVIMFSCDQADVSEGIGSNYILKQTSDSKTESGYKVLYSHFYDKNEINSQPFTIE